MVPERKSKTTSTLGMNMYEEGKHGEGGGVVNGCGGAGAIIN